MKVSQCSNTSDISVGKFGIWGGNQQYVFSPRMLAFFDHFAKIYRRFTVRNITVNNAQIGVYSLWNWGKITQSVYGKSSVWTKYQAGPIRAWSSTTVKYVALYIFLCIKYLWNSGRIWCCDWWKSNWRPGKCSRTNINVNINILLELFRQRAL